MNIFQEFLSICKNLTDEQVKIAFDKFDTSGDDKLDYREFCEMINKRSEEKEWGRGDGQENYKQLTLEGSCDAKI